MGICRLISLICFVLVSAAMPAYADPVTLSVVPDIFVEKSDQTLTVIGSNTHFTGFGTENIPATTLGFIADGTTVMTVPVMVLSDYALHIEDISSLPAGIYDIEVRNDIKDAYRSSDGIVTVMAPPSNVSADTPISPGETILEADSIAEAIVSVAYTLTISAGSGGSIVPVSSDKKDEFLFFIIPDAGYKTVDVTVDEISVGAVEEYVFSDIQASHSLAATFTFIPVYEYCISAIAGPGGFITPRGEVCVPESDSVTFTISADAESQIADLLIDGVFVGATDTYTFERISSDHSITAFFAKIPIVTSCITAVAGEGGTITPSGEICSSGKDTSFAIIPTEGFMIADVLVDGEFIGSVSEYTFMQPTKNHAIFVSFIHL